MPAEPSYRPAVRILLLDEHDRTLLLKYRNPAGDVYWVPPGGGLEDGEDHGAAARRELAEEVGITGVPIEPLGWRRRLVLPWAGHVYDQDERWYVARCRAEEADRGLDADRRALLSREGVSAVRWWTLAEIAAAGEGLHFAPAELAELLPGVLRGDASVERQVGP